MQSPLGSGGWIRIFRKKIVSDTIFRTQLLWWVW